MPPLDSVAVDADAASHGDDAGRRPSRRRRTRRTWVEGGSSVRRWGYDLLGWALICYGAGVMAAMTLETLVPGLMSGVPATAILWLGMGVPVLLALRRSVPRGLLHFRWLDLLYGVVLGGMLRIVQGWLEVASGGSGAVPSYTLFDGALPTTFWVREVAGPVIVSPLLEEFFFHGVLLVVLYTVTRRSLGVRTAGFISIAATTGLFVLSHGIDGGMLWGEAVSLLLVGGVCGLLVLSTGRIWGAVLTHIVFNGLYVMLALAGTVLA